MNWDQIEQKWVEMTRRVQPTHSQGSALRTMSANSNTDTGPAVGPSTPPELADCESAGTPFE